MPTTVVVLILVVTQFHQFAQAMGVVVFVAVFRGVVAGGLGRAVARVAGGAGR